MKGERLVLILGVLAVFLCFQGQAFSDSKTLEYGQNLEQRIHKLEQELKELKALAKAQKQSKHDIEKAAAFVDRLNMSIKCEVWGEYRDPYDSDDGQESDLFVDTLEIYFKPQINEWVSGYIELEYDDDSQDIEGEEARIIIGNTDVFPLYSELGKFEAIPFGNFETFMIEDSLTEEMGEIKEFAAMIGFEKAGFYAEACLYNGDTDEVNDDDDHLDNFTGKIGYTLEKDLLSLDIGASYINNIADSDISDLFARDKVADYIPGAGIHAIFGWAGLTLIGEYITVLEDFDADEMMYKNGQAEPAVWNLEAGYTFDLKGHEALVAAAYQGTEEAVNSLNGDFLPENRYYGHFDIELFKHVTWAIEYQLDESYDEDEGVEPSQADKDETTLRTMFKYTFK
jgi:hypothetical protein